MQVGYLPDSRTDVMYTYIVRCWLSNGLSCYFEKNEDRSALSLRIFAKLSPCVSPEGQLEETRKNTALTYVRRYK